jgi:hypothetical protein
MLVKNFGSHSIKDYEREVDRGGKFVIYRYCISVIFLTYKQPSEIYLVRGGEYMKGRGVFFSLVTFLLGWWGIPWGPIYTVQVLFSNLRGGIDVTDEVLDSMRNQLNVRGQYF